MTEIQTIEAKEVETKNNKNGFTLVELVVVIAILAILAAIAIPVVSSIINSSNKSAAQSNAQTIELAVKECQADITSKNTETYKGGTQKVGALTIESAATSPNKITVQMVAAVKGITDAFQPKTYNGNDYLPIWVKGDAKVEFVSAGTANGHTAGCNMDNSKTTSNGTDFSAAGNIVALSTTTAGTTTVSTALVTALS